MIEHILRRFLEHKSRLLIVIIVILVIGVMIVWPVADEYFALEAQRAQMVATIDSTQKTVSRLKLYEARVEKLSDQLDDLEGDGLSKQTAREFRTRVVELVRKSGCQIRRINLGDEHRRSWRENDDPMEANSNASKGRETKYELLTQQFRLEVTGSFSAVKNLLADMDSMKKLIYTKNMSFQPSARDRKTVVLDLELILFDLDEKTKVST